MTRRTAIRILAAAAAIGLIAQALLVDNVLGVNAPILVVAALAAAFAVRPPGSTIDRLDLWLPPAAVAIATGLAIRSDPLLILLDGAAACTLLGASVAAIGGVPVTRRSAVLVVGLALVVLGWIGFGILRVTAATRRLTTDTEPPVRLPHWLGPIARGILIATPLLIVFVALFAAADAAFARLTDALFGWQFDLGELPVRTAVAFWIAWIVAGLLAVAAGAVRDDRPAEPDLTAPPMQSLGAAAAAPPSGVPWSEPDPGPAIRLGSIESTTILVAVDLLFAVFVVFQLAYLFGGLDTLAATGLPYAQYARRGFFELVAVAILAGGLLVAVNGIAVRRTAALVAAGLAMCGLSAVILASALLRLRIYQDAYGWTELRFYVLATIVWLAIGIATTVGLLARDRMRWLLHGLAISAVAILIAINIVGPGRLIAEQNVARLLNPTLVPPDGRAGLDVGYTAVLGDDAVPSLVAALPALTGSDRADLLRVLHDRRAALASADAIGWPSWNLGREQARQALASLPDR